MGMKSSFVYGHGFGVTCRDAALIEFIKGHKEAFCRSEEEQKLYDDINYTSEEYGLEDFFESYPCDLSGMEGNGAAISNIMSRETGIRFEYQTGDVDCSSFPTVLFSESMPWCFNEVEKNLTEDGLIEILKKYATELGIENDDVGLCEIEYFG